MFPYDSFFQKFLADVGYIRVNDVIADELKTDVSGNGSTVTFRWYAQSFMKNALIFTAIDNVIDAIGSIKKSFEYSVPVNQGIHKISAGVTYASGKFKEIDLRPSEDILVDIGYSKMMGGFKLDITRNHG